MFSCEVATINCTLTKASRINIALEDNDPLSKSMLTV